MSERWYREAIKSIRSRLDEESKQIIRRQEYSHAVSKWLEKLRSQLVWINISQSGLFVSALFRVRVRIDLKTEFEQDHIPNWAIELDPSEVQFRESLELLIPSESAKLDEDGSIDEFGTIGAPKRHVFQRYYDVSVPFEITQLPGEPMTETQKRSIEDQAYALALRYLESGDDEISRFELPFP